MYELERSDRSKSTPASFRIEGCLVLPTLNRIERDGESVQIEPRVMQVLLQLTSRPGEVFSRQELFDTVWADSVVCEEALTRTISDLRRVFRDDTKTPRVIETIRKGGYRLVAAVVPVIEPEPRVLALDGAMSGAPTSTPAPMELVPPAQALPSAAPQAQRGWSGRRRHVIVGAAAVALVVVGIALRTMRSDRVPRLLETTPLTSARGLELFPALSPNGAMLVYCWSGQEGGEARALDLYTMKVPSGEPVRLTSLPGSETWPSWSPDGSEIAFAAEVEGGSALASISVSGGEARMRTQIAGPVTGLDWSPDGRSLVYAADEGGPTPRIHLLRLDDLNDRALTQPLEGTEGDIAPAMSPDGRAVAFLRLNARGEREGWVAPTSGGEARKLELGGRRVSGIDWLSRRELIVAASSNVDFGLWKVSLESGRAVPLAIPGGRLQRLSLARTGGRLAYERLAFAQSIWRLDPLADGSWQRSAEPIIASTQRDAEPVVSPDGATIAFVSDRSGAPELWIAERSGRAPRKLTDHRATLLIRPRWSPDGREIAYSCAREGRLQLFVVDLASAVARPIHSQATATVALWSRHDDCIYYDVDGAAGTEVWRVRPNGADARRISEAGRRVLGESMDGRGLLARRTADGAIVLLPRDGGVELEVVPAERCADWQEVAVADPGFYFTTKTREASTLGRYHLATARVDSLATLPWYAASLSLAPDHAALYYDAIAELEIDLTLVDLDD